jgi:SAM-dependent methyltransferase
MIKNNFVCPSCKFLLEKDKNSYHCKKCSKKYPYYLINNKLIIDFNLMNTRNCECNRDGITKCKINLKSQLPENQTNDNKPWRVKFSRKEQLIAEEIGNGDKILDLGCAEGPYAHLFTEKNECYGFDGCSKRLLLNKNNALDKGYNVLLSGNGLFLPFNDQFFDIVICTEVIEHVTETRQMIAEINRVLKKEGKLILSTPNLTSLGNRIGMILGKGLRFNIFGILRNDIYPLESWREGGITKKECSFSSIRYPEQPLHVRFFTFESVRIFLNQCGFRVQKEVGFDLTNTRIDPVLCRIFKNWVDDLFIVARKKN